MSEKLSAFAKIGLLVFSLAFIFNSCTKEEYYTDPDIATKWEVFDIDISASQWKWNENGGYFECEVRDNRLAQFPIDEGGLQIARVINNDFYRPLPYTNYIPTGNNTSVSETLDYEYGVGWVHFYLSSSDFAYEVPASMKFKTTLWW